jgi:hypothetical protein
MEGDGGSGSPGSALTQVKFSWADNVIRDVVCIPGALASDCAGIPRVRRRSEADAVSGRPLAPIDRAAAAGAAGAGE